MAVSNMGFVMTPSLSIYSTVHTFDLQYSTVFSNSQVNQQFRKILNYWSKFLTTEASTYVLTSTDKGPLNAPLIPWLDPRATKQVVDVAFQYTGNPAPEGTRLQDVFQAVPGAFNLGFQSWDDFFTKKFKEGVRPIIQLYIFTQSKWSRLACI